MIVYPRIFLIQIDLKVTADDVCNSRLFKIILRLYKNKRNLGKTYMLVNMPRKKKKLKNIGHKHRRNTDQAHFIEAAVHSGL